MHEAKINLVHGFSATATPVQTLEAYFLKSSTQSKGTVKALNGDGCKVATYASEKREICAVYSEMLGHLRDAESCIKKKEVIPAPSVQNVMVLWGGRG